MQTAVTLVAFILIRIYTQSAPDENMLFPTAIYIFTCVAGVLYAVKTYRKKMEACDNLIESLENKESSETRSGKKYIPDIPDGVPGICCNGGALILFVLPLKFKVEGLVEVPTGVIGDRRGCQIHH